LRPGIGGRACALNRCSKLCHIGASGVERGEALKSAIVIPAKIGNPGKAERCILVVRGKLQGVGKRAFRPILVALRQAGKPELNQGIGIVRAVAKAGLQKLFRLLEITALAQLSAGLPAGRLSAEQRPGGQYRGLDQFDAAFARIRVMRLFSSSGRKGLTM
jgi:hypothetical protein